MTHALARIFLLPALAIAMMLAGCGSYSSADLIDTQEEKKDQKEQKSENAGKDKGETPPAVVAVYVCGKVGRPGVYELTADSRVCDAIEAAGGVTKEADAEVINQAAPLSDGMRLYVPGAEETAAMDRMGQDLTASSPAQGSEPAKSASGAVNLNTATREELMTLSGIGESKADSIIRYREENGGFTKIEDIMNIRGIKEGIFDQIKDSVTI